MAKTQKSQLLSLLKIVTSFNDLVTFPRKIASMLDDYVPNISDLKWLKFLKPWDKDEILGHRFISSLLIFYRWHDKINSINSTTHQELAFIDHLLRSRHCVKRLTCTVLCIELKTLGLGRWGLGEVESVIQDHRSTACMGEPGFS
jgi:hypothetical protein